MFAGEVKNLPQPVWHAYTMREREEGRELGLSILGLTHRRQRTCWDCWRAGFSVLRSCNAAGPVKEGHKFNYRSIKGDNKNWLHFDHHEIIVRHSLWKEPTHAYAIREIAGTTWKAQTGERSMKNDTLTAREKEIVAAGVFGWKLDSQTGSRLHLTRLSKTAQLVCHI